MALMQTDYECVDGAVECSTLSAEQACGCLRYAGVKMSLETFRLGLQQGRFPFGFVIEGNTRIFIIFRHKLEEWIAENVGVEVSVERILEGVKNL